ncbi:MAG: hypothetical protein J6A59_11585 [Lachnospiraceae bacterium]|nr:hypothetical protein [Lachnospiraceae bacterium]
MNALKRLFSSILLAGLLVLGAGLYYWVIKAGIPYQDPTPEIQLQYSINMGIGDTLAKLGVFTMLTGAVCRIIIGILSRKNKGKI